MTNFSLKIVLLCVALALSVTDAFRPFSNRLSHSFLRMADVECIFPGNKKVKAATGAALKDVAKKAGFTPNYGCEEGKCGSCEMMVNGKTKIRPCIGKVPNAPSPIKFDNA